MTLVVYQHGDRLVGLRVSEIVDIVEVPLVLSPIGARSGSLGSLVVNGHITDVLDVAALAAPPAGAGSARRRPSPEELPRAR